MVIFFFLLLHLSDSINLCTHGTCGRFIFVQFCIYFFFSIQSKINQRHESLLRTTPQRVTGYGKEGKLWWKRSCQIWKKQFCFLFPFFLSWNSKIYRLFFFLWHKMALPPKYYSICQNVWSWALLLCRVHTSISQEWRIKMLIGQSVTLKVCSFITWHRATDVAFSEGL